MTTLLLALALSVPQAQLTWSGPTLIGAHSTGVIGTGDFNGDGAVDVAYSRNGAFHWYAGPSFDGPRFEIGAGSGNSYAATCADVNGDGWSDFVASDGAAGSGPGRLWVFVHPGDGALAESQPWTRIPIWSEDVWHQNDLRVHDLDGDGRLDVAVRTRADDRRLVIALQGATINDWSVRAWPTGETSNGPEGLAVGDLDGDGSPEIVLSGVFWTNSGGWRTGAPVEHLIDADFVGKAVKSEVADLDGDGAADDVVMAKAEGGGPDGTLSIYRHVGDPFGGSTSWDETVLASGITDMHTIAVADMDADGSMDVLAGRSFSRTGISVFLGSPGGMSFIESVVSDTAQSYVTSVVDLDGDGDLDFVGPFRWQGRVQAWWNEGTGSLDETPPTQPENLTLLSVGPGSASVAWSASNDDVGVAGYRVRSGGQVVAQVPGSVLEATAAGLAPGTVHELTVAAFDAAENESAPSSSVWAVTPPPADVGEATFGVWRLDESSGSVAADATGQHPGALVGSAAFDEAGGVIGGAVVLGGGADAVQLGAFDAGADVAALTIATWVRVDDVSGSAAEARFVSKATGTSETEHVWILGNYSGGTALRGRLRTAGGATTTVLSDPGVLTAGDWAHVAMTYDGAQVRLWVDGDQVAASAASGAVPREPSVRAALGNQPSGAGERGLIGRLDDVALLDVALSGPELIALSSGDLFGASDAVTSTCGCTAGPCANGNPSGGCANSTGAGARLRGEGTASLASDDLVLRAEELPSSTFCLLFSATQWVTPSPAGAGNRCIGGALYRWPLRQADAAGVATWGPGLAAESSTLAQGAAFLAGSTWHLQAFYRDVPHGACGATFSTTDAASVTFAP